MRNISLSMILISGMFVIMANDESLWRDLSSFSIGLENMDEITEKLNTINFENKKTTIDLVEENIDALIRNGRDLISSIEKIDKLTGSLSFKGGVLQTNNINLMFNNNTLTHQLGTIDLDTYLRLKQKMDELKTVYKSIIDKFKSKYGITL